MKNLFNLLFMVAGCLLATALAAEHPMGTHTQAELVRVDTFPITYQRPAIYLNDTISTCPEGYQEVIYMSRWSYPSGKFEDGCEIYVDVQEPRRGCNPIPGWQPETIPVPQDTVPVAVETPISKNIQAFGGDISVDSVMGVGIIAPAIAFEGDNNTFNFKNEITIIMGDTTKQEQVQQDTTCKGDFELDALIQAMVGINGNRAQYNNVNYGFGLGAELGYYWCSDWYLTGRPMFVIFPSQYQGETGCQGCNFQQVSSLLGFNGELELGKTIPDKDLKLYALGRSPALWPTEERTVQDIPNQGVFAGIGWQPDWFSLNFEIGYGQTWAGFLTLRVIPTKLGK